MPHYKDGTVAKVGDIVKGKGYNVKDEAGQLKELVGVVVGVELSSSCNLRLAHNFQDISIASAAEKAAHGTLNSIMASMCHMTSSGELTDRKADAIAIYNHGGQAMLFDVEYGQCDQFEKI